MSDSSRENKRTIFAKPLNMTTKQAYFSVELKANKEKTRACGVLSNVFLKIDFIFVKKNSSV